MGHGVTRRHGNTFDTVFHLKFMERIYDGPPRWWDGHWRDYTSRVTGENGERLDRVQDVNALIRLAGDGSADFFNKEIGALVTCVNSDCPLRAWFMPEIVHTGPHSYKIRKWEVNNSWSPELEGEYTEEDRKEIADGRQFMATGRIQDLRPCPQCQQKRMVFGVSPIEGKWVYVLRESGGSLVPHVELEMKDSSSGSMHAEFKGGRFTDEAKAFENGLVLDKIKDHTWHFFLSPVRLGPQALKLLVQAPKKDPEYARKRDDSKPAKWEVTVVPDLQPWTTTVKRRFQTQQRKTAYEYIALVDAFSWVAQIAEFDYLPIAAAQQKLIQDPEEQARAFIAATLTQAIGRRKTRDKPPVYVEDDQWDVKQETVKPPDRYRSSDNIAAAWVARYKETLGFLTKETNDACSRVIFPVRFSFAHRVIEMACQEDPKWLPVGMMHWAHVLREMLISRAGEAFTVWITRNREAADRIPQFNVLGGRGIGPRDKLKEPDVQALAVHLLTYLSPAVIAGSHHPAEDMHLQLAKLGIESTVLSLNDLQPAALYLPTELPEEHVHHYGEGVWPKKLNPHKVHAASGMPSWRARLQSFQTILDVVKVLSLLSAISAYGKKKSAYSTQWDRYEEHRESVEIPVKVVEFLGEKSHLLLKAGLNVETTDFDYAVERNIAEKLEHHGLRALSQFELSTLNGWRSLNAFKLVGLGVRLLAGPVGLVLGGIEIVIQTGKMIEDWEAGDPGRAVADAIQAAAFVLIVAIAGAETVALVTGAGAVAWAGPVGWIAAALMFVSALVMGFCAKNDLQLFARHCFLGKDVGEGGVKATGRAWMGPMGWSALKDSLKARLALVRMLSGFTTWTGWLTDAGGFIFPGYIPDGAAFEVEVEVTPKGQESPKETYRATIWAPYGDYMWKDQKPHPDSYIRITRKGSQVSQIDIKAKPRSFGYPIDYNLRVVLVFDRAWLNALPIQQRPHQLVNWVENKSIDWHTGMNEVNSSQVEIEEEEEKAEGVSAE